MNIINYKNYHLKLNTYKLKYKYPEKEHMEYIEKKSTFSLNIFIPINFYFKKKNIYSCEKK